jgi:membrane protease YdiL (CAAX protease family)
MRAFAKQHSLPLYFVFAFAWFWGCIALGLISRFHFWVPLLGALAPTISAVIVTGISEGEAALRELVRRLGKWRVNWKWYLVVFGLPLAEGLLAVGVASRFGAFKLARIDIEMLRATLPAIWIVFLFAAGEELGWRGYALPRLLSRHNATYASVILGTLHTVWHWPLILLPHQYMSDVPLLPWTISIVAEAVVITWIFRNTGGSVLMVALFHGMSNIATTLYDGIDPLWMPRLRSTVSVLVAVIIVLLAGTELMRTERQPSELKNG